MVFMIPLSVKIALTVGAVVGASVAVIHNKEAILETAEHLFEQGAEFCRNKLNEAKQMNEMHFADAYEDFSFSRDEEDEKHETKGRSTGSRLTNESDYDEISTPETSDFSEFSEMSEFSEIEDDDRLENDSLD
ncbi:uncharacterized protein SPAPADRAFT_62242 [Spathaspora passalidarum NRRL Y-27907]|uniref:Uncharacterized protein n=1 Tax=Spathaspora passalidarum (strain NRRL Y-27907 / 11-Y1) TaxID=619300 RepID=G3AQT4_SPAPN|nr:uncharacterized protein SPAPADRAFT_62242 [Spathaspora passalidarum NRRL Y-27907]EGW31631.1 hypothetical protein SPAPADRAFT_62242 [Spathaspora passalidarum NRRL Y-27907]